MKKKILIVCNSFFAYNKFIKEAEKYYLKNNFLVDVIIGSNQILKKKNKYYLKFPSSSIISYFLFLITPFKILKILNQNSYDIIIHNNRNASICSRLAVIFYKKKITSVYLARGMYFHDNQNFLTRSISYLIEIFLLISTTIVLSQTKEDLKKMSFFLKFFKVKFNYIGNGIDINKYKPCQINNKNTFSTTCRITKGKGLEILLSAFEKLVLIKKNVYLRIIGGPLTTQDKIYLKKIKKKYSKLFLSKNVQITGLTKKVNSYLNRSKFYIHPSFREGLSRSLLEAMSAGNIPVASNIRGSREVIKNNFNGFLYNTHDYEHLYQILNKLLDMSKTRLNSIKLKSITTIHKKYYQEKYLINQLKYIRSGD